MKKQEVRIVKNPKFRVPKVKFNGKYFAKRMREIKRSLPEGLS